VVTVAGTAGMEFTALDGVPCVVAGRSSYTGFGFTIEPETVDEYWRTLDRIGTLPRLSESQKRTARLVFLYSERYAAVRYSWSPDLSGEDLRDPALDTRFWDGVTDLYSGRADALREEMNQYVACVRRPEFSRLAGLGFPDMNHE
jgi:hypothetical protein